MKRCDSLLCSVYLVYARNIDLKGAMREWSSGQCSRLFIPKANCHFNTEISGRILKKLRGTSEILGNLKFEGKISCLFSTKIGGKILILKISKREAQNVMRNLKISEKGLALLAPNVHQSEASSGLEL